MLKILEKGSTKMRTVSFLWGKNFQEFHITFGSEQETSVVLSWSVEKDKEKKIILGNDNSLITSYT